MVWNYFILVEFLVTMVTITAQGMYERSVIMSGFPNILSNQFKHIYLLNGEPEDIYQQHKAGNNLTLLSMAMSKPNIWICSMDTNYAKRKLYLYERWSATLSVIADFKFETNFTGMSPTTLHAGISKSLSVKLAVDWVSDNMYWIDPEFRWLAVQSGNVQNVDQSNYKILVHRNLRKPTAIAVDPIHGFLFWSDVGDVVKIERSNLFGDESSRKAIISSGLAHPTAIDVDIPVSEIFWVDKDRDTIEAADFNGNSRRTVRRFANSEFSDLVVLNSVLTASDYNSGKITLINKHSGSSLIEGLGVNSGDKFQALSLYTPNAQPQRTDLCLAHGCSDLCVSTSTGPVCLCREGYQLNQDNKTCFEVEGNYHRAIVLAGPDSICLKDLRSLASSAYWNKSDCFLNVTAEEISYFDIDMINRKLYYATTSTIYSKIIGDTNAPVTVVALTETITGLSLSWPDRNMYWTTAAGRIQLFSTATRSTHTVLETDLQNPRDLLVLPLDSLMLWINGGINRYRIEKAAMDGTERGTIVGSASLVNPRSLSVDPTTNLLYWTDGGVVKRSALDGTGLTTVVVKALSPRLVTIYKNHIIFTEDRSTGSQVKSAFLSNSDSLDTDFSVPEVGTVKCMKVLDAALQPDKKGPCEVMNGGCEHICLPVGDTKLCRCEYGFTLDSNRETCSSAPVEDNFLLVTDWTHDKIYQVALDTGNVVGLDTDGIDGPIGIGINYKTGQVYWGDKSQLVHTVRLNGTGYNIFLSLEMLGSHLDRLAVDHSTGNVFYTAVQFSPGGFAGVGVISPSGKHKQLIRDGKSPRDIVLDPERGLLFWTDHSTPPFVKQANMDGTSIIPIITSNIKWPNGLAIDTQAQQLYLVDGSLNTLQRCSYAGLCREIYKADNAHLVDVALLGSYLYFTAWNKQYISKLNKDDVTDIEVVAQHSELGRLDSLVLYRSSLTPYTESPLCARDNGGCSTFCLPRAGGRTCACEDGVALRGDGITCSNIESTTTPTTKVTPTTTPSSGKKNEQSGSSPAPVVIGGAAGGAAVFIAVIIVLVVCLVKRNNRSGRHEPFENPAYNLYLEPIAGPAEAATDRHVSGIYESMVEMKRQNADDIQEDDAGKSSNLYVSLQPSPLQRSRDPDHVYMPARQRPVTYRRQNKPTVDCGEDRMSPKLPRNPMANQNDAMFLQVPEDPLRHSVASVDHLQDYMTPVVPAGGVQSLI